MKFSAFNALCPFETGDNIVDTKGDIHTIADIAAVHYVRKHIVEFLYELDNSGAYKKLEIQKQGNTKK
jgi:hypothetical protein